MYSVKKTSKVDTITAAFEILQEKGIEKVSTRDIAKNFSVENVDIYSWPCLSCCK